MQENMNEQEPAAEATETATTSAIDENGVYHTPQAAIDAVTANPPFGGSVAVEPLDEGDKKGNLIGMSCGQNSILAWNLSEGLRVCVAAERKGDNLWMMTASYGGKTRMLATIFGGRWMANTYMRLMRNALTSRAMRYRRHHENRKVKKAAIAAANAERGDLCHED